FFAGLCHWGLPTNQPLQWTSTRALKVFIEPCASCPARGSSLSGSVSFLRMMQNYLQRDGDRLMLQLAIESAVLDIVSDRATFLDCMAVLDAPHQGLVHCRMGSFGPFTVTLNLNYDDSVSIFVDGPD